MVIFLHAVSLAFLIKVELLLRVAIGVIPEIAYVFVI
jgi:hypothetical protein